MIYEDGVAVLDRQTMVIIIALKILSNCWWFVNVSFTSCTEFTIVIFWFSLHSCCEFLYTSFSLTFSALRNVVVVVVLGYIRCVQLFICRHVWWLPRWSTAGCELWPSSRRQIGELTVFDEQATCEDSELTWFRNWFLIIFLGWCNYFLLLVSFWLNH